MSAENVNAIRRFGACEQQLLAFMNTLPGLVSRLTATNRATTDDPDAPHDSAVDHDLAALESRIHEIRSSLSEYRNARDHALNLSTR